MLSSLKSFTLINKIILRVSRHVSVSFVLEIQQIINWCNINELMALTDSFFYILELLWFYLTERTTLLHIPSFFKCIINYVLSLSMPKMKCAGGGDSKYELSSVLLVYAI